MSRLRLLLTAPLLAVLLAAPGVAAQDPWAHEPREVRMEATPSGFDFSSSRDSARAQDDLSGRFDLAAARLEAHLTAAEPEHAAVRLDLTWTELVEYRDADGDGRLSLADPVVQRLALPGLPGAVAVAPLLAGGHAATVTYSLPGHNGTSSPLPVPGSEGRLRLAFALVPREIGLSGGSSLAPTDLGLSVDVHSFPFVAGDTRLALVTVASTTLASIDLAGGGLGAGAGSLALRLAWQPTALLDGATVPAPATVVGERADAATLLQSWPRGERIEQSGALSAQRWDAALIEILTPPGDWRFYALGLAAVAVALGVPSWRRLREA